MTKSLHLSSSRITIILISWLIGANCLQQLLTVTHHWLWQALLFVCLIGLPGAALLRLLRPKVQNITTAVVYTFGLSILVLMLSGLIANELFALFDNKEPLTGASAFALWNIATLLLIALAARSNKTAIVLHLKPLRALPVVMVIVSLPLPTLAIFGAFRLNNGFDAALSISALTFAALLIVATILLRKRMSDGLIAWILFVIGLSVLLMTSLRGWTIVGHDIEREFRVYTLTQQHNFWSISFDHDPYNACLSITILPHAFGSILNLPGVFVFKVLLQIIFAVCPVIIYLLLRQHAHKLASIAGCVLFICYPTFINDSAMLTRQGIAYTFFALALLTMSWAQRPRGKVIFALCALGAILSHYSTAYMFVGLFAFAVVCKWVIRFWFKKRRKIMPAHLERSVLSIPFAILLFLLTFLWYTQITATSNGLIATVRASFAQIPTLFSSDNRSSDTSAAILFSGNTSTSKLYESYLTSTGHANSKNAPLSLTSDDLPLTPIGKQLLQWHINPSIITEARQDFAKVLQIVAAVGVIYVAYHLLRRRMSIVGLDFVCLSIASLALLALMVLVPVLSVNYGILRAFQQALIFLVIPIMMLLVRLVRRIPRAHTAIASVVSVLLFFLFTGWFAQLVGGTSPNLSLTNSGLYYGLYYATAADAASFDWLKTHTPAHADVRAANFNRALMANPDYPYTHSGIFPMQITDTSYVYLDEAQLIQKRLFTYYQSSPLIMTFPTELYDATKNVIFSTPTTRIYR